MTDTIGPIEVSLRTVLGTASWSQPIARRVVSEVPENVLYGQYAHIWRYLSVLLEDNQLVTPQAVQALAARGPDAERTCHSLAVIIGERVPDEMVGWHLELLHREGARRKLIGVADTARQAAEEDDPDFDLVAERLADARTVQAAPPPTVADLLDTYLADLDIHDNRPALPTGIDGLDRLLTGGMRGGQLIVVGARPAIGKSVVLLQIARHVALRGKRTVLFASLEMSAREVLDRYVSAETHTDLTHLSGRKMTDDDWTRVTSHLARISEGRLHLQDRSTQGVRDIATQARMVGADLIVVDYLQLLKPSGRSGNRQEEVSALTRSLKVLARELDVPILVASQLKRPADGQAGKPPVLADLRESGSIEQDSDIVTLLHRDPHDEFAGTVARLIVGKNRNGPTGDVDLSFLGHYASVEESFGQHAPGLPDEPPDDDDDRRY